MPPFVPNDRLEYLYLDLNSYFASVEQQENPALRGRPVAVVPVISDSTCAIAASAEAKAYGIRTGTKIYEARAKCPGLVCVPARFDRYVDYHQRIFDAVGRHIFVEKICSIDEALCHLPPGDRTPERAAALAMRLKDSLIREIGTQIKCSIGIAPNGYLAKIASNMQKPDGLTIFHPQHYQERLCRLKLTDLTGISTNMERRLNRARVYTIAQFMALSPKHARKVWGSVEGERFWYRLHGYKLPDQPTEKSVVGHSRVLDPLLRSCDAALPVARQLIFKAAARLRRYGLYSGALSLSVRTIDRRRWKRQLDFPKTQDSFTFQKGLETLWQAMLAEMRPKGLHKIGISLTQLDLVTNITPDLFDSLPTAPKDNQRLCAAIDRLNGLYGANTITIGVMPRTRGGFVGTKIAFNRIPDKQEFHE